MKDAFQALRYADRELSAVRDVYSRQPLENQEVPGELQVRVKNVIDNFRSSLDFLAWFIANEYGSPTRLRDVQYPLAPRPEKFLASIDRAMPGVRSTSPAIFAVVARHQPYQADHQWLKLLRDLANENKHVRLSAQICVQWTRYRIHTDDAQTQIEWGPDPTPPDWLRDEMGDFLDEILDTGRIGEVSYAPITYVAWMFDDFDVPALGTLEDISSGLHGLFGDARSAFKKTQRNRK
jgi:hypothetical protein